MTSADPARLLAEIHAARAALAEAPPAADGPPVRALWAHARRRPGAPVDFAVERALRSDPQTAARYRTLLSGMAVAHAAFAVAASDGAIRERRVGPYTLTLTPAEQGSPPLLVVTCGEATPPAVIELVAVEGTLRLALSAPVDGMIVIALDPRSDDAAGAAAAFEDRGTEIFLLAP